MMSNSYTIGDFVKESSDPLFGYDLIEESLNFEIASIKYMKESSSIYTDDILESTIEAFSEDGVDGKVSQAYHSIVNKVKNIWNKVLKVLRTFIKNVINLFTNSQGKKIKELEKNAEKLSKELEKITNIKEKNAEDLSKAKQQSDSYYKTIQKLRDELMNSKNKVFDLMCENTNFKLDAKKAEINNANELLKYGKQIENLINRINGGSDDIGDVITLINKVLDENITARVPEYVANFNAYFDKLRAAIGKGRERNDYIVHPFIRAVKENGGNRGGKAVNELISKINSLTNEIVSNKDTMIEARFGYSEISRIKNTIDYYLVNDFKIMNNESDDEKHLSNNQSNLIKNNRDLFGKYLRSISELSKEFQKLCSVVLSSIKQYMDIRDFAINIQQRLQNISYELVKIDV